MPGLAQRNYQQLSNGSLSSNPLSCSNGSVSANGFWSKHRDDVSNNQLQKFWSELSPQARQELLRIDKQTLFEQARKNMYCSRCNGLLLEAFLQIVIYGKSLQLEGMGRQLPCHIPGASKSQNNSELCTTTNCHDDIQDPSVHPWGGLTSTKDGTLTLLDCYLYSKILKGLQNVFDSARARERERELLYPDACGGAGRGWISQGMMGYGRGHGTRETCALHTARLSVDTLVDFWSALGEETQQSLLRMKEEDFKERLMYRFDSKRFCRDCRRNVIHEFKELKELKRMRREPCCTSWFCAADTAFQYEVSLDSVQADWQQSLTDSSGAYHHVEWAIGTGEGKSDILEYENAGMSGRVHVNGLDLDGLNACYITLRAWRMDGRCTELSVKAQALKGQQCVHCRLVVGDGFVTITRGESIRRFFEHAEEAEEEEDDDSMDKDGNELDGECSRPQKHAKSPELAREFLLDAATVIFKEQVEKAFREGTARQNAHSIFVCLALKLLEDRVHVACKEIITLEKQMKLLQEEEKEKREEEERKERRRAKEREKKLRKKERLREKGKDKEKKSSAESSSESSHSPTVPDASKGQALVNNDEEPNVMSNAELICGTNDAIPYRLPTSDGQDEALVNASIISNMEIHSADSCDGESANVNDDSGLLATEHLKVSHRKMNYRKEFEQVPSLKWSDRWRFKVASETGVMVSKSESRHHEDNVEIPAKSAKGLTKQLRSSSTKAIARSGGQFVERLHCSQNRVRDRYGFHACSCSQHNDYRVKVERHAPATRVGRGMLAESKPETAAEIFKPFYCGNKHNQMEHMRENGGRPKSQIIPGDNHNRDSQHTKKVWEPMESQRKYPHSNSDTDVILRSSTVKVKSNEPGNLPKSSVVVPYDQIANKLDKSSHEGYEIMEPKKYGSAMDSDCHSGLNAEVNEAVDEDIEPCTVTKSSFSGTADPCVSSTSSSDNCSSCLSEGDSNTATSNSPNPESLSSSDSEDAGTSHHSQGDGPVCIQNSFLECHKAGPEKEHNTEERETIKSRISSGYSLDMERSDLILPIKAAQNIENRKPNVIGAQHQGMLQQIHNQSIHLPIFQAPSTIGYYHQAPVSWPAAPANGLMPYTVFATPFGYGLNGNSPFMQYGSLHHPSPLLNPGQLPTYQPIAKSDGMESKDQSEIHKPGGLQGTIEIKERVVRAALHPAKTVAKGDRHPNVNPDKSQTGNSGFSLFHFGGPAALSTGYNSNPMPAKDVEECSSKYSVVHVGHEHTCNKKDNIEEYNLFAASNGIRFSFF